jgi:hypothetical protein
MDSPLSQIRHKLFGALCPLPIVTANIYSSSWAGAAQGHHHRTRHVGDCPDVAAVALLFCRWETLKHLTLSGFAHYPRRLSPFVVSNHAIPTYHLHDLELVSCDVSDSTLLWVFGNSRGSLRHLSLSATTGLTPDVLEYLLSLVGDTLVDLGLSLDRDDFVTPQNDPLPGSIFAPLVALENLVLSTTISLLS